MNWLRNVALLLAFALPLASPAAEEGEAETVRRLGESKHSLIDGIEQAEKSNGFAISAKFEFEDGKLWLSVYTAKGGREMDAEHNTLLELKGEPNAAEWHPNTEIFEDKKHLTRSATQLTLMQLSTMSLDDIVKKASAGQKATVYSAIPEVKNGKPIVVVRFATPDGTTTVVNVDLESGKPTKS